MVWRLASSNSRVAGLTIMLSVLATNAHAELTAQERLDAIRQSLIDTSLQTPTRVQTTTWIDSQGSLRESSSFKNGMEVRGVRVLAFDRDETGQPKAKLQYPAAVPQQPLQRPDSNLIKGAIQKINKAMTKATDLAKEMAPLLSTSAADAPMCKIKVGEKLKHVVNLDVQTAPATNRVFLEAFFPMMQTQWINQSKAVGGWRMVNSLPAASMSNSMSIYERALIGNGPEILPWSVKLLVRSEQLEGTGWAGLRGEKNTTMLVHLQMQVTGADGQNVGFEDRSSFNLEVDSPAWSAPKLTLNSLTVLQNELELMRSQAEDWLACQPLLPAVTAVAGQLIEINAGTLAGVKKGDEWLVANPANFPAGLIGKDGASQTLLAKVQSTSPFSSQLMVLAGPVKSVQSDWRAWPTETIGAESKGKTQPTGVTISKRTSKSVTAISADAGMSPY